ncbi:MAG: hypothetical protein JW821_17175 [Deltaproteobacteria bacterium]|nr:hypothetical protein [Deltaproteobacteria bacterium]
MAKVIRFEERTKSPPDNLISSRPWEFRRACWESRHFVEMLRSQSRKLEEHRGEFHRQGRRGIAQLPPHYVLSGGLANTIRAVFQFRDNEERMREVYYLAGLVDCMTNRVNPLLRTDLFREMYEKVMTLKQVLNVAWYGALDQVLFPIDPPYYNDLEYKAALSGATNMKDLYRVIREGTNEMFNILSLEYVFYTPGKGE